ncbi:sterol carrier family protein [Dermatophilus congolensis]|uniref:sterol carrier family protein n=1 Tax=Dermatophilus congolensis TaxID=1863 RepID=UPI001AB015B4|nr:sterol carrier family protein [Dermatophilus congolensis]MBO3143446.1 hypothetical protein [Dermatophilus congolensis]MBO3152436.1 hypothetical protein [Dermatophilus congolensis]MBO3160552.1 hypothetical protein [Dermatophilus congolensis]MBO3163723.1 hypothetical protein [Dermatophilus congolensis]MBO3177269.1 hypothetical protein [Dermatophilus congolensis]
MGRRVDPVVGHEALVKWRDQVEQDGSLQQERPVQVNRSLVATAVRYSLEELGQRHPGHSVEVRVPPFGVVQCVQGPRHTRGVPPNVVEMDAQTWLGLVVGQLSWEHMCAAGRVSASGERSDLSGMLPLFA